VLPLVLDRVELAAVEFPYRVAESSRADDLHALFLAFELVVESDHIIRVRVRFEDHVALEVLERRNLRKERRGKQRQADCQQ
jgi:hypothetical protein